MPEEISVDTTNNIIIVRSWGHITANDLILSRDKIFDIYTRTGIHKVLVDGREQQSFLKTMDSYEYSEGMGEDSRSRRIKYAVVPSAHTVEELRFLETTSKNRGLMVMIHDSVESAIDWLNERF